MRFSKDHKAETRARIVGVASTLFRRDGVDAVSVPALMKEAGGLTHGGFYAHFPSKDALVAEALGVALEQTSSAFASASAEAVEPRFDSVVDAYLNEDHRDHPGSGCAVAALGAETARSGSLEARQAFAAGMRRTAEVVAATLPEGEAGSRTDDAMFLMASMVGAMVVARLLKDDPALSNHVIDVCRDRIKRSAAAI